MKKLFYLIVSTMLVFMLSYSVLAADPGTTPSTAVKVNYNQTYYGGWYKGNDHLNYYVSFEVKQKGLVTFEYSKPLDDEGEYGSMLFKVYNENDDYIWFHNTREDKDTPKETLSYTIALDEGTYLMNVTPGFSVTSGYIEFYYRFKFEADDYCETEPNNTIPEATVTELGKFYKGIFGTYSSGEGSDNCDYFKFQVTKGVSYRVRFKSIKKLEPTTALLDVIMNSKSVDGFSGFYYMDDQYDNDGYAYEDFTAPATGYAYLKLYNYTGTPLDYEVEIDKVPCDHEYELSSTKDSTCSKLGEKVFKCSVCDDSYTEQIAMKAHNYGSWVVSYESTCTKEGLEYSSCIKCNNTIERSIPAAHKYDENITKATLFDNGKIQRICKYCAETTNEEIIYSPDSIELSSTTVVYNGKVRTPKVVVESANNVLVENIDYTVDYESGRKLPGKYIITVTFMGKYEGKKDLEFTICPKATTGVKSTATATSSVTLSWSKTTGATGYEVYQYSSSKGTYVLKKTLTGTSYKVTGLKASTSYKFKVRPYTDVSDGTVVWGDYSSVLTVKTKAANSVDITVDSATIYVGGSKTLKATVTPKDKTVTWKSSDTSIAKVSSSGKVTAVKKGSVTITAYYKYNGKTYKDTCKITVKKPTISLSKTKATVYMNDTLTLKATTNPTSVTVKWTSSNTKIAKVSSSGKITPVKNGSVDITASFTYGGKTYKAVCSVTVKKQDAITIKYVDWDINSADGVEPYIEIKNNTNKDIKYISIFTEYRNKFGDPAYCEIRDVYTRELYISSGLEAKSTDTFYWDAVLYNDSVHRIDIDYAVITFVDGTEVTQDIYRYWYDSYYYYQ